MQAHWSEKSSITLSRVLVVLFGIILLACDIGGWWLVEFVCGMLAHSRAPLAGYALLAGLYLCSVPAYLLLFSLYRLLRNMELDRVFTAENVVLLRRVSWCCAAATLICLCIAPVWPSLALVAIAAAFMALIVRVVKNVFVHAIRMKDELDYTV